MGLIDMMLEGESIEKFEELLELSDLVSQWRYLLHMCYWEEGYESVGGDEGYMDPPPINHERLAYLKKLIAFLESHGITEDG